MGQAIEDKDGFVKLLVNKADRKILGCHIMGSDASTLIHEVLIAMRYGGGELPLYLELFISIQHFQK